MLLPDRLLLEFTPKIPGEYPGEPDLPYDPENLNQLVMYMLNAFMILNVTATLIMLIWSGILYIRSGGSSGELQKAQRAFKGALIGLVLTVTSIALLKLVGNIINVDIDEFLPQ